MATVRWSVDTHLPTLAKSRVAIAHFCLRPCDRAGVWACNPSNPLSACPPRRLPINQSIQKCWLLAFDCPKPILSQKKLAVTWLGRRQCLIPLFTLYHPSSKLLERQQSFWSCLCVEGTEGTPPPYDRVTFRPHTPTLHTADLHAHMPCHRHTKHTWPAGE